MKFEEEYFKKYPHLTDSQLADAELDRALDKKGLNLFQIIEVKDFINKLKREGVYDENK